MISKVFKKIDYKYSVCIYKTRMYHDDNDNDGEIRYEENRMATPKVIEEIKILRDFASGHKYFTRDAYNWVESTFNICPHVRIWQNFIDIILNNLPDYDQFNPYNEYYNNGFVRMGHCTLNLSDFTTGGVSVAFTKFMLHHDSLKDYRFYASRYAWVNFAISSILFQQNDDDEYERTDNIEYYLNKLHIPNQRSLYGLEYDIDCHSCATYGLWWEDVQMIGTAWIMVNYKARIIQRAFRNYQQSKKKRYTITRITSRLNTYRDELIAKALHPDRILQTYEPCECWT